MKMLHKMKKKAMIAGVLVLVCVVWEGMSVSAAEMPEKSVSENSVSENSAPVTSDEVQENENGA